ncbi:iron-sulfur cluster assembly protein [Acidisoma sp. 7E03]
MAAAGMNEDRQRELWRRLKAVTDPELDESVVSMGFVESATVAEDGAVAVAFRLPTYWCSPNFAFLMLEDLRGALVALSWRPRFSITLLDHLMGEEINAALAAGHSFDEIVGRLAPDADIRALRAIFTKKAFQRRQETVLLALRESGLSNVAMSGLTWAGLQRESGEAAAVALYRAAFTSRFPDSEKDGPAFLTWEGEPLRPDELSQHLAALRAVRINMEFNGALCRGLKESRYREVDVSTGEPDLPGPGLADFILGRVTRDGMQSHRN